MESVFKPGLTCKSSVDSNLLFDSSGLDNILNTDSIAAAVCIAIAVVKQTEMFYRGGIASIRKQLGACALTQPTLYAQGIITQILITLFT